MRNWLAVGVIVGMVGAVGAGGCSSGNPAATVSEFCAQKATLECNAVAGQNGQPGVCGGLTPSACISYRTNSCEMDAAVATGTGQRVFNPNLVQACLDAVTMAYANLKFGENTTLLYSAISGPTGDTSTVDYVCESVFQGQQEANAECTSTYDCQSPNVCTPASGGASTQVCAALNQISDGSPCGAAGDVCVSTDACVKDTLGEYLCEATSQTLSGLNAPCTEDSQCDPNSAGFCDIYDTKTCQAGYQFGLGYDCQLFGASSEAPPGSISSSSSSTTSTSSSSTSSTSTSSTSSSQSSTSFESSSPSSSGSGSSSSSGSSASGSSSGSGSSN